MKQNTVPEPRQMEFNLPRKPYARPILRRQRRLPGAHWWFTQMRQAVANAPDWGSAHPAPAPQNDLLCLKVT